MKALSAYQSVFIVGIKGAGMTNIAILLKAMGKQVTGSDVEEEFITDQSLHAHAIPLVYSFDPTGFPAETDLVIYSAAHKGAQNAQVIEAHARKIDVVHQAEVLGALTRMFEKSVAVCGSHGKTTTTACLAYCLDRLGANPSYIVGTSQFGNYEGGAYKNGKYFVVEADEYAIDPPADKTPKIHLLRPTHALCTNIDFDHPDVYDSLDTTKKAFKVFFEIVLAQPGGFIVACADDKHLTDVLSTFPREKFRTYGYTSAADIRIHDVVYQEDAISFSLSSKDTLIGSFTTELFGGSSVSNVSGVFTLLMQFGFSASTLQNAISGFSGSKRRFEKVASVGNTLIFDDYAHHPTEIAATLSMARSRFPGRPITVLFQPHTFSRTLALKSEFIHALAGADRVIMAPIFPSARERDESDRISSAQLSRDAAEQGFSQFVSYKTPEELHQVLLSAIQPGGVIFTMGAGDVYKLKDAIIARLPQNP